MASDDDLAKLLPEAPPRPDRRKGAIAEAMRRFDGEAPTPAPAPPVQPPRRFWPTLGRPQMGALLSLGLIALIGAPLALKVAREQVEPASIEAPAPTARTTPATPPPAGEATPRAAQPASETRSDDLPGATATLARNKVTPSQASGGVPIAPVLLPPPPPPPPPPPVPMASVSRDAQAQAQASARGAMESQLNKLPAFTSNDSDADTVVVTGARLARRDYQASSPIVTVSNDALEAEDENESASIVISATRTSRAASAAARRGDWNACTVIDPQPSLESCRREVNTAAKGDAGRAAAELADGLTKAWKGNTDDAIDAFSKAIAIEPKRAFLYLNRGLAYRKRGDDARALADFDAAVNRAPFDPRGYYHRSKVLRDMDQEKRAKTDEARAVERDGRYEDLFE